MSILLTDNAYSTLAADLAIGGTTMTVATGTGSRFPTVASPDVAYVTLEDASGNREVVQVTTHLASADSFTIVRGQMSTSARAWTAAAGVVVELRPMASLHQTAINHQSLTASAHAASAITNTPSGNLAATTVQGALDELQTDINTRAVASTVASTYAPLASPTFTGTPAAPTATAGTNTTQLATTAFVTGAGFASSGVLVGVNAREISGAYSFVAPAGATKALIEIKGGDGNGGNAQSSNPIVPGACGGEGGRCIGMLSVTGGVTTISGSVGAAASATTMTSPSTWTAGGGANGTGSTHGAGGSASGASINRAGTTGYGGQFGVVSDGGGVLGVAGAVGYVRIYWFR